MHVASEEGDYSFKKVLHLGERVTQHIDSTVCGLYVLTDPDKIVEISIKYLDVNCNAGGLMAVTTNRHQMQKFNIFIRKFFFYFFSIVFRRLGIE